MVHRPAARKLGTLTLVTLLVILALFNLERSRPHNQSLLDFGSFIASGQLAAAGQNPYSSHPLVFRVNGDEARNLNPPVSVLVFHLVARVDPFTAFQVWFWLSLGLYVLSIVLLCRAYPHHATPLRIAWAFSLAGFWHTLELGQIYAPLWLAIAGAWLCLRGSRPLWAGLLIGLVAAVKPQFLVWPGLLFLAGYGTVAVSAVVTAGLVSLVPLAVYGPGVYQHWLALVSPEANQLATNASLYAIAARLDVPWLGVLGVAVLLGGFSIWAWYYRPPALRLSGLALVLALLASPLTWVGYTLAVLPVLFSQRWTPLLAAAAVLLVVPSGLVFELADRSRLLHVVLGSVYGWALLLTLVSLARRARQERPRPLAAMGGHPYRLWLNRRMVKAERYR